MMYSVFMYCLSFVKSIILDLSIVKFIKITRFWKLVLLLSSSTYPFTCEGGGIELWW